MGEQRKAWLRVCASCERVYLFGDPGYCPNCGFGSYGAAWAIGWRRALWRWLTRACRHRPADWKGGLRRRFRWRRLRFEWGRWCYRVHPVEGGRDIVWWEWEPDPEEPCIIERLEMMELGDLPPWEE
jgi:hypothetical protein